MIYGYVRCSTDEERQNVSRQIRDIKMLADVKDENIFSEYESGKNINRTEWNRLLNIVKDNDVIVATEVSRISRSTKQLCDILEVVKNKNLKLILGGFIVDCTKGSIDPMTEGMLKMLAVFAELESNIISQRIKSGLENAKSNGKELGRPKTSIDNIPNKFIKNYELYKKQKINKSDLARITELSRPSINKYIKLYETSL